MSKQAKTTKYEMEHTAIKEQMNLEKHQRKTIKKAKQGQLDDAKADLFEDLDQVNELDKKLAR